MPSLATLRADMRAITLRDEGTLLRRLLAEAGLSGDDRARISQNAADLVRAIRAHRANGLMETFLVEYGLSTDEGIALMCLAEALLRVPDADTIDALIEDKIAPSDWGRHLGKSSSSLVNASTWALMLTGHVLKDEKPGIAGTLRGTLRRLGEPVIRTAVAQAMREMGRQFVLGRTIGEAMTRAEKHEAKGYTYSYDMLGEAALTEADALRYLDHYSHAIAAIAKNCTHDNVRENPGISIKLSALHPRYESTQKHRVIADLVPRVLDLAQKAKAAGMGLNIDAEEADRLDLSLDVIEAVLSDRSLAGWDGFGVVVQAYGRRAGHVIDWLYTLSTILGRRIMVRLVKGAYWDTEIKTAQVLGIAGYPVFTRKPATDLSYIANARKLLGMTDRIYPQFATHNAHTVAAILDMAEDYSAFEMQRLHGMGEALHDIIMERNGTACRIYAPVGAHRDLLAYLVRRLLENGANSSFVNQIVDENVPPERVAADPLILVEAALATTPQNAAIPSPPDIFGAGRRNAKGWNLNDPLGADCIEKARKPYRWTSWEAVPRVAGAVKGGARLAVENPAVPDDTPGYVTEAAPEDIETALGAARPWSVPAEERGAILRSIADLYEANAGEFFALAGREAGKTAWDSIAELREAVDFLRYYAGEAQKLAAPAQGVFACISPWNFPLAIFTGQIAAALAAGNAVIAKPAETTPLIAAKAIELMLWAGVPATALQFLPGAGGEVGAALSSDNRIDGICFTGSLPTAQKINRAMAANLSAHAPLIAETGGINAMIVDSTALPEQAVKDIIVSAFQSAGQRCSALRMLYVQEDISENFLEMLTGAMDALAVGDPWDLATDLGPVIEERARRKIADHIEKARADGRLMHRIAAPDTGYFVGPAAIRVSGMEEVTEEIFGPVLHVATFKTPQLQTIVEKINSSGYGLTFGLHTRVDDRVQDIVSALHVGNSYVNRNQIGAIVGSQPFGGEGLSGTGPKAGGPNYLPRFTRQTPGEAGTESGRSIGAEVAQKAIDALGAPDLTRVLDSVALPGTTGESNRLSIHPRGMVLCLGPGREAANAQAAIARQEGCLALGVATGGDCDGVLDPDALRSLRGVDAVMYWGDERVASVIRQALAARDGVLVPLVTERDSAKRLHLERHLCINTTASGGNTQLLSATEPEPEAFEAAIAELRRAAKAPLSA